MVLGKILYPLRSIGSTQNKQDCICIHWPYEIVDIDSLRNWDTKKTDIETTLQILLALAPHQRWLHDVSTWGVFWGIRPKNLLARSLSLLSTPEPKAHGWANSIPFTLPSLRQHFQTSSPLKPLDQLNSNFIWRLLRTRERKFVQMDLLTWPRRPPRPYMVKPFKMFSRTTRQMTLDLGMWGLPILFK